MYAAPEPLDIHPEHAAGTNMLIHTQWTATAVTLLSKCRYAIGREDL